jgi:hypothetical protein
MFLPAYNVRIYTIAIPGWVAGRPEAFFSVIITAAQAKNALQKKLKPLAGIQGCDTTINKISL